MATEKSTETEVKEFIAARSDWSLDEGKLYREYTFRNFREAFGFMTEAAFVAERANHHPEWCNVYNRVAVHLTTHDAGGISQKDLDLAMRMDAIAARR